MRRTRRTTTVLSGLMVGGLLALLGAAASDLRAQGTAAPDLKQGKSVYGQYCADCHGSKGLGDGSDAKRKNLKPREFARGTFKCRSTVVGEPPSDQDLLRTISIGMPGTGMPAFNGLSAVEKNALVGYLKSFAPQAFTSKTAGAPVVAPNPPAASPALVDEGRQVFKLMGCPRCHGPSGHGDGPAASTLADPWGRPLAPYDFALYRAFKCGNSDQDLYRTLQTGMSGTPMPSFEAALGFAGDAFSAGMLRDIGSADDLKAVQAYLDAQPKDAQMKSLSEADKAELVRRRTWALVRFVRYLATPR